MEISFTSVAVISAVALFAPLAVGLTGVRLSAIVLEILLGIAIGPQGLGVSLPILKDADQTSTPFGQVVVAGASIAEVGPIVLLSLCFSGESGGLGSKLALLIAFVIFVAAIAFVILGLERSMRVSEVL